MTQAAVAAEDPTRATARFARVLPLAFITYSLAYLDRQNFGLAEAAGMNKTLHVGPLMGTLLPAIFFLGYCLFQIPGAAYAAHRSARWIIFWALILWGLLSALTGMVRDVSSLVAARVSLGMVEGVVFPALLVFLTHWFSRREKSRANSLLILANPITMLWMSAASGFLIDYFDRHRILGRSGWQMMFVLEGLPSVLWAFVWLALADDLPEQARWLGDSSGRAVQARLDAEQAEIAHVPDYWAAFGDSRVLTLCGMYLCWMVGSYGLTMWLPSIIREGSRQGMGLVGVISSIPYLAATLAMIGVSYASDYTLNRKVYLWTTMLIGAGAFLVPCLLGANHFWGSLAAIVVAACTVFAPCGCLWAMVAEIVPRNVVGESMALINSAGALGGFIGTFGVGFLIARIGHTGGFLLMSAAMTVAGVLALLVRASNTNYAGHATRASSARERGNSPRPRPQARV